MKKKLAILLSVFAFLGFVAIIGGTVFRVQYVTVTFADSEESVNQAVAKTQIEVFALTKVKEKSIFVVNYKQLLRDIESVNLRISALNVEFIFPSRVKITVRERYAVYYYFNTGNYYILDIDLNIIDSKTAPQWADYSLKNDLAELKGDFTVPTEFVGGQSLQIGDEKVKAMQELSQYFKNINLNEDGIRGSVVEAVFVGEDLWIKTELGTTLIIINANEQMILKAALAYTRLTHVSPNPEYITVDNGPEGLFAFDNKY